MLPEKLQRKLSRRKENNSLRGLKCSEGLIDFSSNDYLGFSASEDIFKEASKILKEHSLLRNGATGSRLLSGNSKLYEETEALIANCHNVEAALIFNSGYDANIGFFAAVPQRGDVIFYDESIHASIRDGIKMSNAKAYKFKHNDVSHLSKALASIVKSNAYNSEIYVITESVFSMDGDTPDLKKLAQFCSLNNCHLIVDEAHAVGVIGEGRGLVQELQLENKVFARIVTFGKALGCHGAAIICSSALKLYLINFARSFIYTTALPPHSVANIFVAYKTLMSSNSIKLLHSNIALLQLYLLKYNLSDYIIESNSAIHCCIIPGNDRVKNVSKEFIKNGFDVRAVLSPTVPKGKERLRICIHSFNSEKEIKLVVQLLATFVG